MSFIKLQNNQDKLEINLSALEIYENNDDADHLINTNFFGANNESKSKSDEDQDYMENLLKSIFNRQKSMEGNETPNDLTSALTCCQLDTDKTDSHVVQVNEDDIIDQSSTIKQLFHTNLVEKYEVRCDVNHGQFIPKYTKLSKSLQRKLANFSQQLDQHLNNRQNFKTPQGYEFNFDNKKLTLESLNKLLASTNGATDSNELLKSQEIITFIQLTSNQNQEFKNRLFRSLRSIVERVLIDALMICDQFHAHVQQQDQLASIGFSNQSNYYNHSTGTSTNPTSKLWLEIRKSGCQFLGPQMQDDVLKLILHCLNTVTRIARKTLVLYVVHMLKKQYPKASKTSVGHVVQLLYKAGCFIVHKREGNASLMELKKEYTKYVSLRRLHDTQIIHIALMAGIRMSPEQWSQKLFGDSNHKSEMQSLIDKLQSQQTLENLIHDFYSKALLKISTEEDTFQHQNAFNELSFADDLNSTKLTSVGKLSQLFIQVREDFEFFSAIIFEKKNPACHPTSLGHLSNSSPSSPPQSLVKDDYNGSSNESEEEEERNFNDILDDEDYDSMSNSTEPRSKFKLIEQKQTKIVWFLLIECMQRANKILAAHFNFSSGTSMLMDINHNTGNFNQINRGLSASAINPMKEFNQNWNGFNNKSQYQRHNQLNFTNENDSYKMPEYMMSGDIAGQQKSGITINKNIYNTGINRNYMSIGTNSMLPLANSVANSNNNNNSNNRNMKNGFNNDYQHSLEMNAMHTQPLSQKNNFFNSFTGPQILNPSISQTNQLVNDTNSFFSDSNNNNNNFGFPTDSGLQNKPFSGPKNEMHPFKQHSYFQSSDNSKLLMGNNFPNQLNKK